MPAEIFQTDGQPGRAGFCLDERLSSPKILANNFVHHAVSIRAADAHVARGRDEAEITQPIFNGAQSAISAVIKIDLASPLRHARVLEVSFERYQRSTMRLERISVFGHAASQSACSPRCVNRYGGEVSRLFTGMLHDSAANGSIFESN